MKKMNSLFRFSIPGILLLALAQASNAIPITADIGGVPTGTNRVNFDNLSLGSTGGTATGPNGSVGVTFASGAQTVTGSVGGQYAAPTLSGDNGLGFGSPDQPNGVDTTPYLSTGVGSVTLTFGGLQQYFGLLWGSVDTYNTLSFYIGGSLVGSVTGSDVTSAANGDQGANGTFYVNINTPYDKVVATSSSYAFEFDNVAYSPQPVNVPDAGGSLALLGLGLSGLVVARRGFVRAKNLR